MGCVGLPLALLFSEQRGRVTGFDIDHAKVYTLNCGGSYIFRIRAQKFNPHASEDSSATSSFAEISSRVPLLRIAASFASIVAGSMVLAYSPLSPSITARSVPCPVPARGSDP